MSNRIFPFSAIVGQDQLKLALILNAVNPRIGGVLVRGEKGTAKSTAVRALAALLPEIAVVAGCPYNCDPARPQSLCGHCRHDRVRGSSRPVAVVTLPLNATEDRVAGGIDLGRAVQEGTRVMQPGLLASAHRGILYVDEVNLLDDHIVDIILDAASSGRNVIEREGISLAHAARFVLVGTMNPEEGELRPQLLDRFGLCVEVRAIADQENRVVLMERREAYDASPSDFSRRFRDENAKIAERIVQAGRMLAMVRLPGHLRSLASQLAMEGNVAGHRADLIIEQAAKAVAAWRGRREVTVDDVLEVAPLVLFHRSREAQPPPPPRPRPVTRSRAGIRKILLRTTSRRPGKITTPGRRNNRGRKRRKTLKPATPVPRQRKRRPGRTPRKESRKSRTGRRTRTGRKTRRKRSLPWLILSRPGSSRRPRTACPAGAPAGGPEPGAPGNRAVMSKAQPRGQPVTWPWMPPCGRRPRTSSGGRTATAWP